MEPQRIEGKRARRRYKGPQFRYFFNQRDLVADEDSGYCLESDPHSSDPQ